MRNHFKTRKYRFKIADLVEQGKTLTEAEDEVFKGNSNKARDIKSYHKRGLSPYGEIDKPTEATMSSSLVKENDAVLIGKIEKLINKALEQKLKAIEERLRCSSSVLHSRPKLRRTLKNCSPTSFRLPRELVQRAKQKARTDPIGVMGLNSVVETLLWRYIGSPTDLLE